MLKATIIFDNWIASDLSPKEFIKYYYLTKEGIKDCKKIEVEQDDDEIKESK